MKKLFNNRSILCSFVVLTFVLAFGAFTQTFAQDQYVIAQAQQAVSDKIIREKGGYPDFILVDAPETYYISNSQTGVKGYGTWMKNLYSTPEDFSYEARVDNRRGTVDKIKYKILADRNSGNNNRIPSWAIGTFYGRNPQTGGTITLAISNNGSVVITFENGATNYASISGDRLTNNGVVAKIVRLKNGLRATRIDNGETIDYYRNGNDTDNGGNVPTWAIGTFYAKNPQTGGTITLDISNNGSVVITFENGATNYASISGDRLNNNGVIAKIGRLNNGIRATRIDNGETIDYYKNGNGNGNANVPSWALGTFYGRNPQTGGNITLNINADGTVEITFDGDTTNYATIYKDQLTNNGVVAKITKINGGIRATRLDNGERIDYRRQ